MTINQYLWMLEVLKIRRENAYERWAKLSAKAAGPQSSWNMDADKIHGNRGNIREELLIRAADAEAAYWNAYDAYETYRDELETSLSRLEYRDRVVLEHVYIYNLDKDKADRTVGICRLTGARKRDIPVMLKDAKQRLRQVLLDDGIDIE